MMRGGTLRVAATSGAAVAVGKFTSSTVSSVSLGGLYTVVERPWMRAASQCSSCPSRVVECRSCNRECNSECTLLPVTMVARRSAFSTCDSNKIQWRPNYSRNDHRQPWLIRGMAAGSAAEVLEPAEVPGLPVKEEERPSKPVTPKYLIGKTQEELEDIVLSLGEQKYRGKQMYQLIYKNKIKTVKELAQLPKQLRNAMTEAGWSIGRSPIHHVSTSKDGTVKILLKLEDNRLVEAVGIPVKDKEGNQRLTVCVSSQVGCALRCAFCATGKGGFARNLKAHEIVDQVLSIEDLFRQRVTNIVFMGMGEPLMNLDNVLDAHRTINKELQIGQRMMTISTVGVPNTIRRLATHKLQSTLAISLHAPNQELRSRIVPSAKGYPLDALMEDCKYYFETTGRRLSFEYTLLAGVNDQREHAEELATLLHQWNLGRHVNIIPYNPIADSEFERPTKAKVLAFVETLSKRRVTASVRVTRGLDANAACGQLRNEFQKIPLQASVESPIPV
ncbi:uncharacterized protein [Physcomitrium patens]|uniref:Radical SAM core domain-containing protein n=1 Tax=Physcomitrium patens TaxID=3218 RepID=A0A2K1KFV2_PHYPA|nr:uncharacterized protein LOC112284142 isoform X2 [Physcomitrium patens]PNR52643.1 hypothetical protein PHYPA_009017 [Physcomitrium patens]|eukprot:XP_024379512.1 uncharacterized protein LOC112284142 isoform X2 [Physcomitrella patens]